MSNSEDVTNSPVHSPVGKSVALHLTKAEQEELRKLTKATKRTVAEQARVLLDLDQRLTSIQVAQKYQLHPVAVRRIKQQFQKQRLEALIARKHTGRLPKKREAVERFLQTLEQRNMLQNPERGVLSVAAIQQEMQKEHQILVCINTIRNALKKRGLATDGSDIV